jgi:20S proteasome subunit alpha 6
MRTQALQSRYIYNRPLPVFRIVSQISDKAQRYTLGYGGRPYGVGLLVVGVDVLLNTIMFVRDQQ